MVIKVKRKYRIVKSFYINDKVGFEVQRKTIFGWWWNFNNIDAYTTGQYNTMKEAEEAIDRDIFKVESMVVATKED